MAYSVLGKRTPKMDGPAKATGGARFSNDIVLPRMLHGKILRSPHPHARILHIDTSLAMKLAGVKAVVTGKDTAGVKFGVFRETRDQYAIPIDKVRYIGDEVAAVAAVDEDTAEEALGLIRVEYGVLAPAFDPLEAMKPDAPLLHEGVERNVSAHVLMEFGEVENGFLQSDYVREDRFETSNISHCTMEPYAAMASYEGGYLDVWVPNQGPFMRRRGLSNTLKLPLDNVRVHRVHIGGAFGGRSEMMSCEFSASLLSMKTGRPVRIAYTREETFTCTRQKHPFVVDIKTGVKKDGTLMARQYKVVADGGAYLNTGPITISDSFAIALAQYRLRNARYEATRAYTNKGVRGAMKGQGSQQVRFAEESQIDMIAQDLGLDPVEVRLKNAVEAGDTLVNKSRVTSCGLKETIRKSADAMNWRKPQSSPADEGQGVGISAMISGFSMGIRTSSSAFIKFNEDAQITLISGTVDNGQGNETMVALIAAEELGIPMEDVRVVSSDTTLTPQDPGSYSMASTFVSGNAARLAAADARAQILEIASEKLEANPADLDLKEKRVFVKGSPAKSIGLKEVIWAGLASGRPVLGKGHYQPDIDFMDTVHGKIEGQITGAFTFGSVVARVKVDRETGQVDVTRVAAAHDCGQAINAMAVEGQIEGSVVIGQGQVLSEEMCWDGGQCVNPSYTSYGLPTALETPQIEAIIVESDEPNGPYGAKEAAETINIAIVPALANAISEAVGVRIQSLPITPERVLEALDKLQTIS
ncbi:MAG: xanthine dehydrogenase family protein molybdopterin-binding subunit [Dehalococcoidia bacterium]|nr:xanthine dehydrogenase family protein molybdopterin-binding subunit [Dehalococcoidia bacterium]